MNLSLAFWADSQEDALEQAASWVAAEPNVTAYKALTVSRPYAERDRWYEVAVELVMGETEQTTWMAA